MYVEGKLKTRSYEDQDKNTKYITEIIVDNLVLLGGPNRGDETSDSTNDTKTKDDAPF